MSADVFSRVNSLVERLSNQADDSNVRIDADRQGVWLSLCIMGQNRSWKGATLDEVLVKAAQELQVW